MPEEAKATAKAHRRAKETKEERRARISKRADKVREVMASECREQSNECITPLGGAHKVLRRVR